MAVPNFESQGWKEAVREVKEVTEMRSKEGHEGAVERTRVVATEETSRSEGTLTLYPTTVEEQVRFQREIAQREACLRGEHVSEFELGYATFKGKTVNPYRHDQAELNARTQVCRFCRSVYVSR